MEAILGQLGAAHSTLLPLENQAFASEIETTISQWN